MTNSFRFRVTAWYLAFLSVLLVVFGLFLYRVLAGALEHRLDEELAAEANILAALFQDEITEMAGDIPKAAVEAIGTMQIHNSAVAVLQDSRVLASSLPAYDPEFALAAHSPGPHLGLSTGYYGARAAVQRLKVSNRTFDIVALQPLDSVVDSLRIVRRVLALALPALLALAGFGGYLIIGYNLAPIGRMAEQTRRITGSSLDTRLDIGPAADELAVLSSSFNELLARLHQSFETMRRFVADASHELRTPISVIRGEADVALSKERSAAEYRESLAIVLDEARRISRLLDDLLNLARADAGHARIENRSFYFNDLLGDCCRSVQPRAAERSIALDCRTNGDIPFQGDEQLMRRLLMNLLENAIRYTPEGGRVFAALETRDTDLRIRIADTGTGIAPEAAPHIFERFYRADEARSRKDGGFGLGLSIVKWIAESHRGEVTFASTPGAGSTFTVTLPRA